MTTKNTEEPIIDCSTAGMGFARTGDIQIASESCGLPQRGFATTDFGNAIVQAPVTENTPIVDCSTAGMGFARTDKTKIAPENCSFPSRGFGTTDFGNKNDN